MPGRGGALRALYPELLPPYLKKAKWLEAVLPWLYLKGVSTNDFDEALTALFGESVKGLSPTTIARLKRSWEAEYARWRSRKNAEKAFERFISTYEQKYPKAVDCLVKDREELLAFYDFPAAHWQHIRTTNPIESTFATIRLRTRKTRNCVSARSGLTLLHQLAMSAQKRWRRLRGFKQLADVISGVKFIDGVDAREVSRKAA